MNQDGAEPGARGADLVVMVMVALATLVIPAVKRWLERRTGREEEAPRDGEDVEDSVDPSPEGRSEEPLPRPYRVPRLREPEIEEGSSEAEPSPRTKPPDVPSSPRPDRPARPRRGHWLEVHPFAQRRWSPAAKLIIAKEILDRPRYFRRKP